MTRPLLPTCDLAKRFAAIMHRRLTTPWHDREVRAYKQIAKHVSDDDMANLERYYAAHWPPDREKNILRHDLLTLLNNAYGEIDRANIWCQRHPIRKERKIIPMPPHQSDQPAVTAEPEVLERFMADYQARKQAKAK